eukprot:1143245-Pelagomonas_calceolata.AAC.1
MLQTRVHAQKHATAYAFDTEPPGLLPLLPAAPLKVPVSQVPTNATRAQHLPTPTPMPPNLTGISTNPTLNVCALLLKQDTSSYRLDARAIHTSCSIKHPGEKHVH